MGLRKLPVSYLANSLQIPAWAQPDQQEWGGQGSDLWPPQPPSWWPWRGDTAHCPPTYPGGKEWWWWWHQVNRPWRVCIELSSSIATFGDVTKSKCSVIHCLFYFFHEQLDVSLLCILLFDKYEENMAWLSWRDIDPKSNIPGYCDIFCPQPEISNAVIFQDILPHLGSETDICMSIVTENLMTCLGSQSVILRKTTVHILQIYLRFSSDVQAVIRSLTIPLQLLFSWATCYFTDFFD